MYVHSWTKIVNKKAGVNKKARTQRKREHKNCNISEIYNK